MAVAAYLPALRGGFIWDDDNFVTLNPIIHAADGLRRFWFSTEASDYWPVTSSTLWLEWRLWGLNATGYHVTNVLLHALEVVLLWSVLRRLAVPGAGLAALLFAVHPLNVESVAWIAQRKNLMAMLFYLAAISAFLRCWPPAEAGRIRANRWYWLSLGAFVLAMLSKGSVAILPLVLLGIVLWRRRPERRDALPLAPFFLVAAALAEVNVWFQTHGSGIIIRRADFLQRVLGAGAAVWFYLGKALWPTRLIFVYPQWRIDAADPRWWLPLVAAVAVTAGLMMVGRLVPKPPGALGTTRPTMARALLFAWLYFCVALIPVMGFANIAFMEYSLVANHYAHLALIGVTAAAGAGWSWWQGRRPRIARAAAALVVLVLFALTWRQDRIYSNVENLYRETLRINPDSWVSHGNLASLLAGRGDLAQAAPHYEAALRLHPDYPQAHVGLGSILASTGHFGEAIEQFRAALALRPDFAAAHMNLGLALEADRRPREAIVEFQRALAIDPSMAPAENGLGFALAQLGRLAEAIPHFQAALQLNPNLAPARANLELAERMLAARGQASP